MIFYEALNGGNCVTCRWIVGEGVIKADTADAFVAFLAARDLSDARGLNIHLNSPGGNLMGGVRLGLAIRQHMANTVVSAAHVDKVTDNGIRWVSYEPPLDAICASACVFAFAGGVSRFASDTTPGEEIGFQRTGRLGVHQFYKASALATPEVAIFNAEDAIADQKTIALLLGFLSEMDVSADLLQLAAQTDPRDMHYLDEAELNRTRIDNRMVKDVFLTGYKNGVTVAEVTYRRQDGDYRLEMYCRDNTMQMLVSIDWRGNYDVPGHSFWNLFDDIRLKDGGQIEMVSETFRTRDDGGVTGQMRFRFSDPLPTLVDRKMFQFEDWSSRYANDSATSLSFVLPGTFDGLYLLPRTCM